MTPTQFRRWQKRMGWSVAQTAQELRLHERQIYSYRSGACAIPPLTELACQLLEERAQLQRMLGTFKQGDAEEANSV